MKALSCTLALGTIFLTTDGRAAPLSEFPTGSTAPELTAWLGQHSDVKAADVVAVGGGRVVALAGRRGAATASPQKVSVTVRTEVIDRAVAESGVRSEANDLDVDCAARKVKMAKMETYSLWGLKGARTSKPGWADWVSATPNTVMARIVDAACDPAFRGPLADVKLARQTPPPAPAAPPIPTPRAAAPPPKAAVQTVKAGPAAPPVVAQPATGRASLVQIAAANSQAQAQAALDRLKAKSPQLLKGRQVLIEPVTVDGRTFHRAMIGGFGDPAQAGAFCSSIKASGGDCIVRKR